jgi:hypothetical protein
MFRTVRSEFFATLPFFAGKTRPGRANPLIGDTQIEAFGQTGDLAGADGEPVVARKAPAVRSLTPHPLPPSRTRLIESRTGQNAGFLEASSFRSKSTTAFKPFQSVALGR